MKLAGKSSQTLTINPIFSVILQNPRPISSMMVFTSVSLILKETGNRCSILFIWQHSDYLWYILRIIFHLTLCLLIRFLEDWRLFLHDFTAPFFLYLKVRFEVRYERVLDQNLIRKELSIIQQLSRLFF